MPNAELLQGKEVDRHFRKHAGHAGLLLTDSATLIISPIADYPPLRRHAKWPLRNEDAVLQNTHREVRNESLSALAVA